MSDTPQAGWYRDPGGSRGQRYWDGTAWTEHLQADTPTVAEVAATPVAGWYPEPGQGSVLREWDGTKWTGRVHTEPPVAPDRRRSRTPWAVAGIVVLALVAGLVTYDTLLRRGATTPLAAAEGLIAAVNSESWLDVARLLPPDEVDWAGDVGSDLLSRFDALDGVGGLSSSVQLEVELGEPRELTDGLQFVPIDRVSIEALDGPYTELLGLEPGQRETEDLRDEPSARLVTVHRGGRWFVSPVGTLMEIAAYEEGQPGAGPAMTRSGNASPSAAVEEAASALGRGSITDLVSALDPDELGVLDHYEPYLRWLSSDGSGTAVRLDTTLEGSSVVVRSIEMSDSFGDVGRFDVDTWCFRGAGTGDECLADEFDTSDEPWVTSMARAVLEPDPAQLRVGTVQRDGRHYVSLQRTLEDSVRPVLGRVDDHTLLGAFEAGERSPHALAFDGALDEVFTLELHDNWNAIRFPESDGHGFVPCAASEPLELHRVTADGYEVRVRNLGYGMAGGAERGILIWVVGAPRDAITSVDLRLVEVTSNGGVFC